MVKQLKGFSVNGEVRCSMEHQRYIALSRGEGESIL
jgi:hypothetical protein